MFGSGVQSSWATPQQNQPSTSAFGQTGAFGQPAANNNAFGSSTGAFGAQQQQQPAHNPMFGNLGGAGAPATTGAFGTAGGFGANNQATPSAFGGVKPTTGFGGFGGGGATSTFGAPAATSAFGQPAAQPAATSVFGQPAGATSAFGAGATTFGQPKPAGSAFGAFGTTGSTTTDATAPVTTGSSNPPYSVFTDKDSSSPNVTLHYQAISCIPAYKGTSFEEIRVQDYAQNRKVATATTGGFGGAPSAFGAPAGPQTSAFGGAQPSVFGAAAQPAAGAFGASTTAFGQPAAQQPAAAPSIFGAGASAFGQQPQQQQPQTSLFGQPQQQQGQQPGAFGGFGQQKPATTAFGGAGGAFGTGAFGQTQQPQAQSTSIFGQAQQPQQPAPSAFGGFGNTANAAAPKSIFGGAAPAAQPSVFGTGNNIFGGQPLNQTQPANALGASTNLFGNTQQQPTNTLGLPAANQSTTTPFGGSNLFGGNNGQSQPAQNAFGGNNSLFGKPAAPANGQQSLFPSLQPQPTATTNLFGNNTLGQNNMQQNSLFGAKPPALGQSNSMFGGFGNSTGQNGVPSAVVAQPTLTASIAQPVSTNLPIFSLLPAGPRAVDFDQSTKKKASFFFDKPMRTPLPLQLSYSPASSSLRGYSSVSASPSSSSLFSTNPNALSLVKSDVRTANSLVRSSSPSLGSGQRQSVKKLVIDKKIEPSELFAKSGSMSPLKGGKITFSPALSVAARESAAAASPKPKDAPAPAPTPRKSPNRYTAASNAQDPEADELQEGDYWVKPAIPVLRALGYDKLSAFTDLTVGREGYGMIEFLEPVDLTGLSTLADLQGSVIRFDHKECTVYPDHDDVDKPPPGSGLNVRARITLKRCWVLDKSTREPLKDENHPQVIRHLKKLKAIKDTHFEGFDISDGSWTFSVDHF